MGYALWIPSWLCGNFCFFICGYYQHHAAASEHSCCYDDTTWNYTLSAFQTVDRKFGWFWDNVFHHLTDGHVAHHLFFASIPHYHLPEATRAIETHLKKHGFGHYYKVVKQERFWIADFMKDFYDMGFRKTFVTMKDVMMDEF